MPVTLSGMSGIETEGMINKLVEVEARPIRQLEIRKKNLNIRKESLKSLGKILDDVNSAAKDLFGIRAPYNEKTAQSSDKSVLEAKADKSAEKGVKKIKVIQIASSHKISSDPVQENDVLPAGRFTVEINGEKVNVNFSGGKLKALKEKIDEAASELVATSYIKKSDDSYILTIQSNKTGEKGEIKISGDKDLLKKIGVVNGQKADRSSEIGLVFDKKNFEAYSGEMKVDNEDGNLSVARDGKAVAVQGLLWREYILPTEITVKEDMDLEFEVSYQDRSQETNGVVPRNLEIGPREKVNIKGIILEGYNINRKREGGDKEEKRVFESLLGVGLVGARDGKRIEKIYPLTKDDRGNRTISLGKDYKNGIISKIIFYCNRGTANFSNARLSAPVDRKGGLALKNVISPANDAKLTVDGIEITRDRNEGLNDVIKGVILDLKRASSHEVDLQIEHSTDPSIARIKKFVEAYNKYLDYDRELTKAAKAEKPGDYTKTLQQSGLFVGDMTLLRLENMLKMTVNGAYPGGSDKPIKVLPQMGVSTGAINADWETIKSGKLVIDEALLKKTISENPDGVSSFFGSDTDGDNKIDNGMAFKVVYVLKPYITAGKNIISTKIEYEDNSIKVADENIKKKEDHLKKYQDTLKRKFARMERAITESNSKKQWMKNQMDGLSSHSQSDSKKEK